MATAERPDRSSAARAVLSATLYVRLRDGRGKTRGALVLFQSTRVRILAGPAARSGGPLRSDERVRREPELELARERRPASLDLGTAGLRSSFRATWVAA